MTKERWSNSAEKGKLKKGPWTFEEDLRLLRSIRIYGEGRWSALAKAAGLQRCGKSCRLRWVNYLRPDLKRGNITPEEERMIIELHSVWGNRWSLIAEKMPGRTDNEIKNYWRCHLKKKLQAVAAGANKEARGPPMQSNPESSFRNVQQAGSTHTNTNSNQVQNQNQNPFLDCLQSPLSLPSENNSNNQSHKLAEYGGPSSTSNDLVDIKPDVQAEGSGVPLPGILCRLGSEIPLIEDDLTALQGMGAEHRGEMYPTQHQALQECCNFDSAIEMDMTSDSILWGMCPLLAQPQPQPQNSFCDHAQLTYDVPPQNVDPKHVSLL